MKQPHDYSFRNVDYNEVPPLSPTPNAVGGDAVPITEDWEIVVPSSGSRLVRYFSGDLRRFFEDAFGVSLRLRRTDGIGEYLQKPGKYILLTWGDCLPEAAVRSEHEAAYRVEIGEDRVVVAGRTERGCAKGVYALEDSMRLRGECSLVPENGEFEPLFYPRMTHSGEELDTFSDSYLEACAHAGMDAILVYAGHPDSNLHGFTDPEALWPEQGRGYCDFSHLVWRAEGYGLYVYVYNMMICDMYPGDPGSEEYYEGTFGQLFRNCPGIRGIVFVGESFEFPSRDPHTAGVRLQRRPEGETRPSPGWYPCSDYPLFVEFVKNIIRKYNPEADIVFWSYNWGYVDREARLALIEKLPKDISYLVTFDMWQAVTDSEGNTYTIDDYSVSFPGPSRVFTDEAEKAKELGLRLYAMTNTGGRTWDNGASPYLPVPQQWQKRYEALRAAHDAYGLCGLMEDHHYGWFPSFLSLFAKNAYTAGSVPDADMLRQIANRDWGKCAGLALEAWADFSDALSRVIPANVDQYGPYRSGPTYPLLFSQTEEDLAIPYVPWAEHKGGGIWNPVYPDPVYPDWQRTLMRYRHVRRVRELFGKGLGLLEEALGILGAAYGSEISRQAAVARFLYCSYVTAEHVMAWTMAKRTLLLETETGVPEGADAVCDALGLEDRTPAGLARRMKEIAAAERENVCLALTAWEEDSRIGFEATMEYVFNKECAEWKLAETERTLALLDDYLARHGIRL